MSSRDVRRGSSSVASLHVLAELRACAVDALHRLEPLVRDGSLALPLRDQGLAAALVDTAGYDVLIAALATRAADEFVSAGHVRMALRLHLDVVQRHLQQNRPADALPLLRTATRILSQDAWPSLYAFLKIYFNFIFFSRSYFVFVFYCCCCCCCCSCCCM